MECNINQNNAILIAQSISKLVEKTKDKSNSGSELKYLKEKLITCEDSVVNLAASRGLIMLVEWGKLQASALLSELISSLSVAKTHTGITVAICDLLQMDLKCRTSTTEKYKCPFNLRTPQHPLVSVLKQHQESWIDIFSKLGDFYEDDCTRSFLYANEALYPFYMYVICNPTTEVTELFQHKLWNYLIRIEQEQTQDLALYVIMWLQISSKTQVSRTSNLLIDLLCLQQAHEDVEMNEVLLLWLTSLVYELIKNEYDPRCVVVRLQEVVSSARDLGNVVSSMAIMLANCIVLCPSVYLCSLLKLCKTLVQLNLANLFALQTIRISLLQWQSYACVLTADSLQIADDILLQIEYAEKNNMFKQSKQLYLNKKIYFLKSTNNHVHMAVELSILSESLTEDSMLDWLNRIDKVPVLLLKNMFSYFAALLLNEYNDQQITTKVINILVKITNTYKEIATQLLTLVLYKLSNTLNSEIRLMLLKALPKMAVLKENLPLILNTLDILRGGMVNLRSFVLTLFYELWEIEGKCYPQLQNVLLDTYDKRESTTQVWEVYITKAYILKQICLKRPEVHGRELVGHLSEILNKCGSKSGGLASSLAIDGIKALCSAGIVDIHSTWDELAPRFSTETRSAVIRSLCGLIIEVSYFDPSDCPEKLLEAVLTKLWQYVEHEDVEVISASVKSLQCFTLEQISLYLPDSFKTTKAKSGAVDNLVFGLLPGDCWINLLLYSQRSAIEPLGNLLINFITTEVASYHSGTYKVEGRREPPDLNYLPQHSIVRALGNYIRQQVQKWHDSNQKEAYLQCLRILSQQYPKPLPPVDWCFLQELVHHQEARSYCITLASHQVQLSGTARRLIENYVSALTNISNNIEDVKTVYKNLKYLSNSIQPMTLQPFIERSIKLALQNEELFDDLIMHLKNTLADEHLHEANRLMLSQVIVNTVRQLDDVDHSLFSKILDCIVVLPIRHIDELSSPRLWKGESTQQLKLSVRVRCALAQKSSVSPLTWLNDVIDAACFMEAQQEYVLKNIAQVMQTHRHSDFANVWILELLGNIQSSIANENKNNYHLKFLCDVFILSMVMLAGQDIFVIDSNDFIHISDHRLHLFPQSVALLMKTECWKQNVSQVSDWLYYMTHYHDTPQKYKTSFYQALAALRHEDVFIKQFRWMKYIGTAAYLV